MDQNEGGWEKEKVKDNEDERKNKESKEGLQRVKIQNCK